MYTISFPSLLKMYRNWINLGICCVVSGLLVACTGAAEPPQAVGSVPTATATLLPPPTETSTATPLPTATPTPTLLPTPTPVVFPDGVITATVVSVIDGITIGVEIDGSPAEVRYLLLSRPEERASYAEEAAAQNEALVAGQTVYLERDSSDRDSAGRLLRYVYLPDGRMVNEILLSEGHAQVGSGAPDTRHEDRLRMRQADAMLGGLGMWGMSQGIVNRNANLPRRARH